MWMSAEHERVERLIEALDAATRQPPVGAAELLDALRSLLGEFRTSLLTHFGLEEDGGYLNAVLTRRPTLDRQVEQLKDEHRQFAVLLDHLLAMLDATGPADFLLIRECCARIQSFVACTRDHEQRENALVADVQNIDIGTSD